MNNSNIPLIILSALLGILLGALAMPLVREPQLPISGELQLPISGLISAATTVAIGWWIHSAVRRRGELDRISIDYLSNLNRRIDELISTCLDAATEDGGSELDAATEDGGSELDAATEDGGSELDAAIEDGGSERLVNLRSCLKTPCGPPQGSSKRSVRRAFFIG